MNVALVGSNFALKGYLPVIKKIRQLKLKILCNRKISKSKKILSKLPGTIHENNWKNIFNDDIDLIIGPVFSSKVNQISEITKNTNIPIIALSNNSEIQDDRLYVFGLKLEDEIKELLTYSINRNLKKYAVLVPRNEF